MMQRNVCLSLTFLTFTSIYSYSEREIGSYGHKVQLKSSPDRTVTLHWAIDRINKKLHFELKAKLLQMEWVGLGFSDHGEVENADFILLWYDQDQMIHFKDAWTDRDGRLHLDSSQNYHLVDVKIQDDCHVITFSRLYDTCDTQDYQFQPGTSHILHFIAKGPISTPKGMVMWQLGNMVHTTLTEILIAQQADVTLPRDTYFVSITQDNVEVPAEETSYICHTLRLPNMPRKQHIVKYEVQLTPGNEELVHHINVWHCEVPVDAKIPIVTVPCLRDEKIQYPPILQTCTKSLTPWAYGGVPIIYPNEAGESVGGQNFSPYVMIQIHYTNNKKTRGIRDSSGVRWYVSPTMRPNDAATMLVGSVWFPGTAVIPPAQRTWNHNGYCDSLCTQRTFPAEGIRVFAVHGQMHFLGRRLAVKHYRNGRELQEIFRDNHFDSRFQAHIGIRPVTILPGDIIILHCEFDSTDTMEATMMGHGTLNEMCVASLDYYPAVPLKWCLSDWPNLMHLAFFNYVRRADNQFFHRNTTTYEKYKRVKWTPRIVKTLHYLAKQAPITRMCVLNNGTGLPTGEPDGFTQPRVRHPLKPSSRDCL